MSTSSSSPGTSDYPAASMLIVARCVNLHVSSKQLKATKSGSLFSKALSVFSTPSTTKNDKWVIKLSQSEPFKPTGRPPSYNFTVVYTSEPFEDAILSGGENGLPIGSTVAPSLVAEVHCPEDADCKLRLSVFYSSNQTSGKDILLAATTFSVRELLRVSNGSIGKSLR